MGAERFAEQNFLNPRLAQRDIDSALDYRGTDGGYFEAAMERPDMWAESFPRVAKTTLLQASLESPNH